MANGEPSRREMLTINAFDPETGGVIEVCISYGRLQAIRDRTRGQVLEAAEVVSQILQDPSTVFEGLTTDADEDRGRGVGWLCYCGLPDRSYSPDGERCPPRKGQVFLAFVNEDNVVYNWRWEKADPDNPHLPLGWQDRFTWQWEPDEASPPDLPWVRRRLP